MKQIIVFIMALFFYNSAFTSDITVIKDYTNKEEFTIPFIVDKSSNMQKGNIYPFAYYPFSSSQITASEPVNTFGDQIYEFGVSNIKKIIRLFKDEVCQVNKGGTFEITLKADASGKIIGIGTSTEGGLKINIFCELDQGKK